MDDNYSDEDYDEDFQDNADDGTDEMEKIRNAMAREKLKADKFKERQVNQPKITKPQEKMNALKFQGK